MHEIQVATIGVACLLICAPIVPISSSKYYGVDLLPPFGMMCVFVPTVPVWGPFGIACPLFNYLVPACLNAVLTMLLCARLKSVAHETHNRLHAVNVLMRKDDTESEAHNSTQQLSVRLYLFNL